MLNACPSPPRSHHKCVSDSVITSGNYDRLTLTAVASNVSLSYKHTKYETIKCTDKVQEQKKKPCTDTGHGIP